MKNPRQGISHFPSPRGLSVVEPGSSPCDPHSYGCRAKAESSSGDEWALQLDGLPEERQMTHPPRSISQTRMDSFLSSCQTKKSSVGPPRVVPLSFKMVVHVGVLFHRRIHLPLKAGSKRRPFLPLVEMRT